MLTHAGRHKTEDDLVAGCLRGNAADWEALIARYQSLIYSIALRSGLSAADADDVFQNVCLKLCLHLGGLRENAALTGWIGAVTRQECGHLHRRSGGNGSTANLDEIAELPSANAPLEEALLREERTHTVRRGLEELPTECQRLLTLLYSPDEPLPYTDIAVRLGLPTGSIGPKRARCLERLRKKIVDQAL